MGIPHYPGELEKLIGVFYRVNAKHPPRKPSYNPGGDLERLVITQGLMQMTIGQQEVHVEIPHAERVDRETYLDLVSILGQTVTHFCQVPQFQGLITQSLQSGGIMVQMENGVLRINPLVASVGLSSAF